MKGRRILKGVALGVIAVAVGAATLFFFGLRVVLDGGGGLHLRFVESSDARLRALERDRAAQRASAPPAALAPAPAASPARAAASPAAASPAAVPERRPYWTDFRGPNRDGHYR